MPKGGHAHSGPPRDPNSRTSERRGFTPASLPATGFDGDAPDLSDYLPGATARHELIWSQLWRTPQAWMWNRDRWRVPAVADLVRCQVRSEDPEAPAAWETPIQQRRTELGLNDAGLRFNGWTIGPVEVDDLPTPKAKDDASDDEVGQRRQRRLRGGDAQ